MENVEDEVALAPSADAHRHRTASSHLALLAAATIYSGFNVLIACALAGTVVSPIGFSVIREACALPLLYIWAATQERPFRMPLPAHRCRFAALGVLLACFQLCFAIGVSLTDSQTAALFQCLEPSTAALLGAAMRLEKLTVGRVASALLAGGGVLLMQLAPASRVSCGGGGGAAGVGVDPARDPSGSSWERTVGSLFLFGQGVGIAAYCLLQKGLVRPQAGGAAGCGAPAYGPVTITAHAYGVSLLTMLAAAAVDTALRLERVPPLSAASLRHLMGPLPLAAVAYAVVLSSCVGYSLRAWANRRLDASTLVLYNAVQPPVTALVALVAIPGTRYGPVEAAGSAMVMAAVWVSARGDDALARVRRVMTATTSRTLSHDE